MDSNLKRAIFTGLLVGGVLILINHLDTLLYGKITPTILCKIIITPIVPFFVSFYSAKLAIKKSIEDEK